MMEKDPFVEYSRNKLEDFRAEIDGEEVWLNIKHLVPTNRRKKRGFWWFFGLFSILFLIGIVLGFEFIIESSPDHKAKLNSNESKGLNLDLPMEKVHLQEGSENLVDNNQEFNVQNNDIKSFKDLSKSSKFNELEKKREENHRLIVENSLERIHDSQKFENHQDADLKVGISGKGMFLLNNIITLVDDENEDQGNNSNEEAIKVENPINIANIPSLNLTEVGITDSIVLNKDNSSTLKSQELVFLKKDEIVKEKENLFFLEYIPTLNFEGFQLNRLQIPELLKFDKNISITIIEGNQKPQSHFGLNVSFYGGLIPFSTHLSPKGSDHLLLLEKRRETEKDLGSFNVGFDITKDLGKGFYFSAGFEYINKRSQFSFNGDIITLDSVEQTVLVIMNPFTGNVENHLGNTLETTTTTYRKSIHNQIHYANVLLGIGYNYNFGNWNLGFEPGIKVNTFARYNGQIFRSNLLGFYNLENDKLNLFKNRFSMTIYSDIYLEYEFGNSLNIFSGARYHGKTVISNDSNEINESFWAIGLMSGIRIRI